MHRATQYVVTLALTYSAALLGRASIEDITALYLEFSMDTDLGVEATRELSAWYESFRSQLEADTAPMRRP